MLGIGSSSENYIGQSTKQDNGCRTGRILYHFCSLFTFCADNFCFYDIEIERRLFKLNDVTLGAPFHYVLKDYFCHKYIITVN